MITSGMMTSKSNEWETPQDFFDELDAEFHFTLDPCATKENAKCEKFYTKEDDGLLQQWSGETVFMNPPYGREIGKWVKKASFCSVVKKVLVVGLIPARTDTKYWHDYIHGRAEVRFIKGRLYFSNNGKTGRAPFPSAIVIWR